MPVRGFAPAQGERVTPGRKSHLRLDTPDTFLVETPFARSFVLDQMALGERSLKQNVHFLPQIGWELIPNQLYEHDSRETTDGQAGSLDPIADGGSLQVGTGWVKRPLFHKPTMLGALSGADPDLVTSGDGFIERTVAAGANWGDHNLTADQASYPGPHATQNIKMDRVAANDSTLDNEQSFVFRCDIPGNSRQSPKAIKSFYYPAPAGYHSSRSYGTSSTDENKRKGLGQYCMTLYGDGRAGISEKTAFGDWTNEVFFKYAPTTQVSGRRHTIYVRPIKSQTQPGAWRILFRCENTAQGTSGLTLISISTEGTALDSTLFIYRVPRAEGKTATAHPVAPRVDARRDIRSKFQIKTTTFPESGLLRCDPFSIPFFPTSVKPLRIVWLADLPTGCSITVQAFDARTGVALTPSGGTGAFWKEFSIAFGQDYFYVEFTLHSNILKLNTPILYAYRAQRDGRIVTSAPTEVEILPRAAGTKGLLQASFRGFSLNSSAGEPLQENGSVKIFDLLNSITRLKNRGDCPFIYETEYDASDPTKRSILLEGYYNRPVRERRGRGPATGNTGGRGPRQEYPNYSWSSIQLQLIGKWKRLSEQYSNVRFNWHWIDPDSLTGAPYKATDAIRYMLGWCGFTSAQIAIDDRDVRLWSTDNEMDLFMEPGAPILEYIMKICRDYLRCSLCWDANAGTAGVWRLIFTATPPYKRLARFVNGASETGNTFASGRNLVHNLKAYGLYDDGGGRMIQNVPIFSHSRRIIPPEANAVLVTGVAFGDYSSYKKLTQWAVNPKSFNFYDGMDTADPDDPSYLGRIVPLFIIDPGLNTEAAVNWATRVYYNTACVPQIIDTVQAPLVLIDDPNDAIQRVDRKLRYYDPVVWEDGKTWLVQNVAIGDLRKDWNQQATYDLFKPFGIYAD